MFSFSSSSLLVCFFFLLPLLHLLTLLFFLSLSSPLFCFSYLLPSLLLSTFLLYSSSPVSSNHLVSLVHRRSSVDTSSASFSPRSPRPNDSAAMDLTSRASAAVMAQISPRGPALPKPTTSSLVSKRYEKMAHFVWLLTFCFLIVSSWFGAGYEYRVVSANHKLILSASHKGYRERSGKEKRER